MSPARREALVAAGCYGAYLAVRSLAATPAGRRRANANAATVVAVEQRLGLRLEPRLQAIATRWPRLVVALNASYAVGNLALSVGWLALLLRQGHPSFHRERRAAVVAFLAALPAFAVFPVQPPRAADDEVVDTFALCGLDLEQPLLIHFYNPIAAMPSHHAAFAVVTGLGLARAGHPTWLAYPPAVALTVVATGNHFVLDVLAGAGLGAVARWVTR